MTPQTPGQAVDPWQVITDLASVLYQGGQDAKSVRREALGVLERNRISFGKPLPAAQVPGQAALLALVNAHFVGNGPYSLQLVCTTEDASDVECDETIAEVEPGATWDELEARIAEHAVEYHAVGRKVAGLTP